MASEIRKVYDDICAALRIVAPALQHYMEHKGHSCSLILYVVASHLPHTQKCLNDCVDLATVMLKVHGCEVLQPWRGNPQSTENYYGYEAVYQNCETGGTFTVRISSHL